MFNNKSSTDRITEYFQVYILESNIDPSIKFIHSFILNLNFFSYNRWKLNNLMYKYSPMSLREPSIY